MVQAGQTEMKGGPTVTKVGNTVVLDDVTQSLPPLTLANNEPREFWELTLEEAMQNALANSKVLRTLGGVDQ